MSEVKKHEGKSRPIKHRPYYEKLGIAHDYILRCAECKRIVTFSDTSKVGGCPKCGHRRMNEIKGLSLFEWLRIRLGLLRFPHRDLFLKEFGHAKK